MTNVEDRTLGSLLEDPLIRAVGRDAVRGMDLTADPAYHKTLREMHGFPFGGDLTGGFTRLLRAAESRNWLYPLYSEAECAGDPEKAGSRLVWFPSDDPKADERPFVLVIPGGGFENVWNLTEGWPIGAYFNKEGYHAFILTYRTGWNGAVLRKEADDIAAALRLIADRKDLFRADIGNYITCGFSAGGYLTCLWSTGEFGYEAHDLPKPKAMIPVYPVVSWRSMLRNDSDPEGSADGLFGCPAEEALKHAYEIEEHVESFPPCAIYVSAGDTVVPPVHSQMLYDALVRAGIPASIEMGPEGQHGFADGTGTCMEGWITRAVRWIEENA